MYLMRSLFQGDSDMDQISKIASVLGTPKETTWPEGKKQAALKGINIPEYSPMDMRTIIPNCSE